MPKEKLPPTFESEHFLDAFDLPAEKAIEYLGNKGYQVSWSWKDVEADAHQRAFTVAKVMQMDVLEDIRGMIVRAQKEGITFQQFKKDLQPKLEAKGWWGRQVVPNPANEPEVAQLGSPWRLENIYRTNMASSYMAGRFRQAMTVAERRPYWQYDAVNDSRVRASHLALDGVVLRYDDPFWQTSYPPNSWRCRCVVRTLSEKQLKREGLKVSTKAPDFEPDPSFSTNPAEGWEPDLAKYPKDLAEKYSAAAAGSPKPTAATTPASPPAPAAPAVATQKRTLITPADVLDVQGGDSRKRTEDELRDYVDIVSNLVSQVHGVPAKVKPIPVAWENQPAHPGMAGWFSALVDPAQRTLSDLSIHLNSSPRTKVHPVATLTHEFGHFFDAKSLPGWHMASELAFSYPSGRIPTMPPAAAKRMREFILAAYDSEQIRDMIAIYNLRGVVPIGNGQAVVFTKQELDYYLKPSEVFARAYTQWVALHTGDTTLQTELEKDKQGILRPQWLDGDFVPIADALDELFTNLKLMK